MDEDSQDLFEVLQRGDRKIAPIQPYAYLIIGLKRSGKSALFNNILGKSLVGRTDEMDQSKIVYVPNIVQGIVDQSYAQMGSSFSSVTLAPNIADYVNKTNLIDMAGFGQNRNEVGVMAVSYFLISCFQKLEKVKFVIAFSQDVIMSDRFDEINSTFSDFIDLFNIQKIEREKKFHIKTDLIKSISIVITRATKPADNFNRRFEVISRLLTKDKKLSKTKHKELIIEIFNHVREKNRIDTFEQALENKTAKKFSIFQRFDKLDWNFFDIKAARQEIGPDVLVMPFERDYKKLTQQQSKNFQKIIEDRIKTFITFNQILGKALSKMRQNWTNALSLGFEKDALQNLFDMREIFSQIDKFLKKAWVYKTDKMIDQTKIKLQFTKPEIITIIQSTLRLYDCCNNIFNDQNNFIDIDENGKKVQTKSSITEKNPNEMIFEESLFLEAMKKFTQHFPLIVNCLLPFCQNAAENYKIEKIKYILKRGLIQFSKLYELKPYLIQDLKQVMKDTYNQKVEIVPKQRHLKTFIKGMKINLIKKLFKTEPSLNQYEELLKTYIHLARESKLIDLSSYIKNQVQTQIEFNELKIDINLIRIEIHMENVRYLEALNRIIQVFQLIFDLSEQIKKNELITKTQLETKLRKNHLRETEAIKIMVQILIKLNKTAFPSSRQIAINLLKLCKCVDNTIKFYEIVMKEQSDNISQMLSILDGYIQFCKTWGQIELAERLLFKKIDIYEKQKDLEKIDQTKRELVRLDENSGELRKKYKTLIYTIGAVFSEDEYEFLNQNLCLIKQDILSSSKLKENS